MNPRSKPMRVEPNRTKTIATSAPVKFFPYALS
jgi:hypothetical protein